MQTVGERDNDHALLTLAAGKQSQETGKFVAASCHPQLRPVRLAAVVESLDPLSFERLHMRPSQVGALFSQGHRVEPALYHWQTVGRRKGGALESLRQLSTRGLTLPAGTESPVTGKPVDSFRPVPSLSEPGAFLAFLDWDEDGLLTLFETAIGCAAVLPTSPEVLEAILIQRLHVQPTTLVPLRTLEAILNKLFASDVGKGRLAAFLSHTPKPASPRLHRNASDALVLRWLSRCDADPDANTSNSIGDDDDDPHAEGTMSLSDWRVELQVWKVCVGIAKTLYHALGSKVSLACKEAALLIFLKQFAHLPRNGLCEGRLFAQLYMPSLLANLPALPVQDLDRTASGDEYSLLLLLHLPLGPCNSNVDLVELREGAELPKGGGTLGELREAIAALNFSALGTRVEKTWTLFLKAEVLTGGAEGDHAMLKTLPGIELGAIIQALPGEPAQSSCAVA